MDCPPGAAQGETRGNYCAVGTMLPCIEVWDLDVLDAVEPVLTLGVEAPEAGRKKSRKSAAAAEAAAQSHAGAVMGLSWNGATGSPLASLAR